MGRIKDLTGKRFGSLTVLKRAEDKVYSSGRKAVQWLCRCDCKEENEVIVTGDNLKGGNVQSCGCLLYNKNSKLHKKYNVYDLTGNYGIGYTFKGEKFYFDLDDYDKIKNYCWYTDSKGYIISHGDKKQGYKVVQMHMLVTNCKDGLLVDHINHKVYDNRKLNLRVVTNSQNQMNSSIRRDNTSGIKGVSFDKLTGKWIAYITINKENYRKEFETFEDAVKQREKWTEKHFGEFSYRNSINMEKL